MRTVIAAIAVLLLATPVLAQQKDCEELRTEIEAKIKANGVEEFTLDIVPNDQVGDRNVVGSCDGGTSKIVYTRG
ncbi:MAG: DUF1161 domain-containing protein [Acidobacteria bacterium]|nr:DUF1161 domain-containing protein [Acidobacteriota bacterium]